MFLVEVLSTQLFRQEKLHIAAASQAIAIVKSGEQRQAYLIDSRFFPLKGKRCREAKHL
jgi:hypothetical protein